MCWIGWFPCAYCPMSASAKVKPGIIKVVDKSLRDHTYTDGIWKTMTGKNLDELWADYIKNPAIA